MKVLVIDDDRVFSEPLMWQLEQEGYEVQYCLSVAKVLNEKGNFIMPVPDILLLDIMMPRGMKYSKDETDAGKDTGLKLLEDIQKRYSNIPVIILTVRQDLNLVELQKKFGDTIKGILVKPVTPSEVIKKLNTLETN